jgi:hypothetical protein
MDAARLDRIRRTLAAARAIMDRTEERLAVATVVRSITTDGLAYRPRQD